MYEYVISKTILCPERATRLPFECYGDLVEPSQRSLPVGCPTPVPTLSALVAWTSWKTKPPALRIKQYALQFSKLLGVALW